MANGDSDSGKSSLPDVAKFAVAGIAVITAVTGIVGGLTGGVARLARNSSWVLPLAIVLIFLAVGLALVATIIGPVWARQAADHAARGSEASTATPATPAPGQVRTSTPPPGQRPKQGFLPADWLQLGLVLGSVVLFGIAATIVTRQLSNSLATPDRPIVSAKWVPVGGRWVLSGTARASGLKTTDQLAVAVFRMVGNGNAPPPPRPTTVSTNPPMPWWTPPDHYLYREGMVYELTAGADIDGNATVTFEVPLPDGYDGLQVVATLETEYGCGQRQLNASTVETPKFACLTLDAPEYAVPSATA